MKIVFIRPNMFAGRSSDAMEPLAFALLTALTPAHYERTLYDERIEPIIVDDTADLVAITVETFTARRAYQISQMYRSRGIKVVMGGYHPTLHSEEALLHADAVCIGDAEEVWTKLLSDLEQGNLQKIYRGSSGEVVIPKPDRTIFSGKSYNPLSVIQFGRGCRFACDFCSIHAFYGKKYIHLEKEKFMMELQDNAHRHLFIADDNFFSNKTLCTEMMGEMSSMKLRWSSQASIDIVDDDQRLKLLKSSGCHSLIIGFESLNSKSLKAMGKSWNMLGGAYEEKIKKLHDHGIQIYATFVFGYDHDKIDDIKRTLDFALNQGFFLANFNPLTPTPGTELYSRLKKQDRLLYEDWWLNPQYRYGKACFMPKMMSPTELEEGVYQARREFYGFRSRYKRLRNSITRVGGLQNLMLHWLVNSRSGKEIDSKQWSPLGEAS